MSQQLFLRKKKREREKMSVSNYCTCKKKFVDYLIKTDTFDVNLTNDMLNLNNIYKEETMWHPVFLSKYEKVNDNIINYVCSSRE